MNLIYRKLTSEISKLLKYYPVISITGQDKVVKQPFVKNYSQITHTLT